MGSITQGGIAFGQAFKDRRNKKIEKEEKYDLALAKAGIPIDKNEFKGLNIDQSNDLKLSKLAEATKSALDTTIAEASLDMQKKKMDIRKAGTPNLKELTALATIDTVEKSLNEEGKRNLGGVIGDFLTPWATQYEEAKDKVPAKEFRDQFKKRFEEFDSGERAPSAAPEGITSEDWANATEEEKKDYLKGV